MQCTRALSQQLAKFAAGITNWLELVSRMTHFVVFGSDQLLPFLQSIDLNRDLLECRDSQCIPWGPSVNLNGYVSSHSTHMHCLHSYDMSPQASRLINSEMPRFYLMMYNDEVNNGSQVINTHRGKRSFNAKCAFPPLLSV